MVYLRARFYEPEMNCFSQKDLLRGSMTTPQTLNRYAYCGNDPVNFIDPSGMRLVENDPREVRSDLIVPTGRAGTSGPSTNTNVSAKSAAQTAQNVRVQNRLDELDERDSGSNSPSVGSQNNDPSPASPQVAGPTGQSEACDNATQEKNDTIHWIPGWECGISFGFRFSVGTQFVSDEYGNEGVAITISIGGGTPFLYGVGTYTKTQYDSIYDLEGVSWDVGGGTPIAYLGFDKGNESITPSLGLGCIPGTVFTPELIAFPTEAHGVITSTVIIDYETWNEINDNITRDGLLYG